MPKQCRQCYSVVGDEAPYCEACGCQFLKVPAGNMESEMWQYIPLAIAVVVLGLAYFGFHH